MNPADRSGAFHPFSGSIVHVLHWKTQVTQELDSQHHSQCLHQRSVFGMIFEPNCTWNDTLLSFEDLDRIRVMHRPLSFAARECITPENHVGQGLCWLDILSGFLASPKL